MWRSSDEARRRAAPLILAAFAGAMLAGCAVGPEFQRPAAPATSAYAPEPLEHLSAAGDDAADGDRQQIADTPALAPDWWSRFGSPALDETMRQALAGNQDLAAAAASLAQARAAVDAERGTLDPQVSGDVGVGRQQYGAQFGGTSDLPPFTYYSVGPGVRYAFDYLGGERRAVERQAALAQAKDFEYRGALLSLTGNVAQQALRIASLQAQLDTLHTLIEEDRRNASLVQSAFDTGAVNRVDVLSAQTQLANDETRVPPLERQLDAARHALSILVGRAPADWVPPPFRLAELTLPRSPPVGLPSELVHRRPDILASEAQLHAATAAVGVSEARLYPQITLTASVGAQSSSLSHLFDGDSAVWGLAGGLTAPLWDGGTLRAQKRGADAALQAAFAQYRQTVLASFGQVADALSALDHDAAELAAQQRALVVSQDNLGLTRDSYAAGNAGVLQVLDAERLSQQATLGVVQAQAQRYQDTAQLFLALGGSVVPDEADVSAR